MLFYMFKFRTGSLENVTFLTIFLMEGIMSEQFSIYRCNECGCMIEIIKPGKDTPSCCGKAMETLEYNTDEAVQKKHTLFVVGDSDNHSIVRVGGMGGHPMKKDHAIEWVEIISFCGAHHRRFLEADDEPESWFLPPVEHVMKARAYCGKHGLWKWEKKD